MTTFLKQLKLAVHPSAFKHKFLHFALRGNNVECVCCGSKYITFLPAGLQKRSNAKCIKCGSLERHRTLWMFLKDRGFLKQPLKLLHVAPEKIFYNHFLSLPQLDYHPIDLMPDKYAYGGKTTVMDVTEMTYADNSFDAVMCNHVLEHIREDSKAMQQIFRVLKPGGWAILNTPVNMNKETTFEDVNLYDPKKQLELFGQSDHVRIYGRDFITRLEAVGFKVDVIDHVSKYNHNDQFRFGLQQQEVIYFCTK